MLGPSGCGKTSLLRLIAGLLRPDAGTVRVGGAEPVPGRAAAMVFQSYRLLPWKTVRDNVAFALPHLEAAERAARVDRVLAQVGLARFGDAWPRALSGGMQQRANLARALTVDPEILLMDEPFAALDAQTRELMQAELLRIWKAAKKTVCSSPTRSTRRIFLSDRIVLLSPRPGRVVEELAVRFPAPRWRIDRGRRRSSPHCGRTSGSGCARWCSPTPDRTSSPVTHDVRRTPGGHDRAGPHPPVPVPRLSDRAGQWRARRIPGAPHLLRRPQLRRACEGDGRRGRPRSALLLPEVRPRAGVVRRDGPLPAPARRTTTTSWSWSSRSARRPSASRPTTRRTRSSATPPVST